MSSNLLLSDPILSMLDGREICRLKQVNKEYKNAIKTYMETKKRMFIPLHYNYWSRFDKLLQQYPSVENIHVQMNSLRHVVWYLRKNLKSIHLDFSLSVDWSRFDENLSILETHIREALLELKLFVEKNPDCLLEEIHIDFMNPVGMFLSKPKGLFSHYDRDGPVYDDYDWSEEVNAFSPYEYMCFLTEGQKNLIRRHLRELYSQRVWKTFSLPSNFPGADTLEGATVFPVEEGYPEEILEYAWYLANKN